MTRNTINQLLVSGLVVFFLLFGLLAGVGAVTVTQVSVDQDSITANSVTSQIGIVNSEVSVPPSVLIRNGFGTPVSGVNVEFSVASGGGSIVGSSSVTTDANGVATVAGWVLGPVAGVNSLAATNSQYVGSPISFNATTAISDDLTGLALSGSPSNYTFSGSTYSYNGITVANGVSSITVTPTGAGTITVNGTEVSSGNASGAINLTAGVEKTITVVVTETGKTAKTYTLRVTRSLPVAATPTFSPVAGAIVLGSTVTISSTTSGATIYYTTDGSTPTTSSTAYSAPVTISSALTLKAIAVASGYSNSAVGEAVYTQAASSDLTGLALSGSPSGYTFSGSIYSYSGITVANDVSSITVTPTGAGTITVNGTEVSSGNASGAINLTAGVEATITVVVTETGKTAKTYTLKITRIKVPTADLTNLVLSGSPSNYTFAGSTYTYDGITVANAVSSVTVTPTGSGPIYIRVNNGIELSSGNTSQAISLTVGVQKTITVVVTEAGKTSKTYTLNVTRNEPDLELQSAYYQTTQVCVHIKINKDVNATIPGNMYFLNGSTQYPVIFETETSSPYSYCHWGGGSTLPSSGWTKFVIPAGAITFSDSTVNPYTEFDISGTDINQ